jgi:non-heme chloroperoxidase
MWVALAVSLFGNVSGSALGGQTRSPVATMVETEPGVKVEVLDWGGAGPPLVMLAGLGGTARGFDKDFVEGLKRTFHVYGITRRGFGASSAPVPDGKNYSADRLGDDVLAVLDRLHLERPLLVGHSLAGEELSSIGSRRPGRVAGLVYLDAGYRYALSGPGLNDLQIDSISMRRYLAHALADVNPVDRKKAADNFLGELPDFEKELRAYSDALAGVTSMSAEDVAKEEAERQTLEGRAETAILDEEQRYSLVRCPMLVIFAYPHALPMTVTGKTRLAEEKRDMDFVDQRVRLFKSLPDVNIVLLPHATHDVQSSKREDVLKAIEAFEVRLQR